MKYYNECQQAQSLKKQYSRSNDVEMELGYFFISKTHIFHAKILISTDYLYKV